LNMEIEEGEQNVEPKKLDFDVMGTRSSWETSHATLTSNNQDNNPFTPLAEGDNELSAAREVKVKRSS
jgi:hypothetical protein